MSRRTYAPNDKPNSVDGQNAIVTEFYRKRLRTLVKGRFEVTCPDEWDKDYFLNMLINRGYFLITDSRIGVNPFKCSLHGLNYMNLPTKATVATPVMPSFQRTLDEDAVLIYLERLYGNYFYNYSELIRFYAVKLAMCDISIDVNLLNTRIAHVIEVESKAQAATVDSAYDKLSNGEPLVVLRKDTLSGAGINAIFNNVQNTYIVNDILDSKRTIINEFLTAIGVNNANTDKKERVIESEVAANDMELDINTVVVRERLKEQCKKASDMFGIDFSIKVKEYDAREMGAYQNGSDGYSGGMGKKAQKNG